MLTQKQKNHLIRDAKKEVTKIKAWETEIQLKSGKLRALDERYWKRSHTIREEGSNKYAPLRDADGKGT